MARAVRLIAQAGGRDDAAGWLAVLQQLELCVRRVAEAQQARREADEAAYLLAHTQRGLDDLRRRIHGGQLQPAAAAAPQQQAAYTRPVTTRHPDRGADDRGR